MPPPSPTRTARSDSGTILAPFLHHFLHLSWNGPCKSTTYAENWVLRCFRWNTKEPWKAHFSARLLGCSFRPEGTFENSPAIYRWGVGPPGNQVPTGTAERPVLTAKPAAFLSSLAGLIPARCTAPTDESVGYSLSPPGLENPYSTHPPVTSPTTFQSSPRRHRRILAPLQARQCLCQPPLRNSFPEPAT